jgi:hypothetical protein
MATTRVIASAIWRDEWFGSLDFFQQALWIGLFSGCADDQGRLEDNPFLIRADVCPYKDISAELVDTALGEFADAGKLIRYTVDGHRFIQIVNWWDHQRRQWAQPSRFPSPPEWVDSVRTCVNKKVVCINWPTGPKPQVADQVGVQVDDHLENQVDAQVKHEHEHGHGPNDVSVVNQIHDFPHPRAREEILEIPKPTEQPVQKQKPAKPSKPPAPPLHPAITVFRESAKKYPQKPIWAAIIEAVGDEPGNLTFWGQVVTRYIGTGWNPGNVLGMIDWFKRRELPGVKHEPHQQRSGNSNSGGTGMFFGNRPLPNDGDSPPDRFKPGSAGYIPPVPGSAGYVEPVPSETEQRPGGVPDVPFPAG